jgi:hypothetical protein
MCQLEGHGSFALSLFASVKGRVMTTWSRGTNAWYPCRRFDINKRILCYLYQHNASIIVWEVIG